MKIKKLFALLLSAVILSTMAAGCGNDSAEESSAGGSSSSTASAGSTGSDYSTKRRKIQSFNAHVHGLFTVSTDDTQKTHLCPTPAFDMRRQWCIM